MGIYMLESEGSLETTDKTLVGSDRGIGVFLQTGGIHTVRALGVGLPTERYHCALSNPEAGAQLGSPTGSLTQIRPSPSGSDYGGWYTLRDGRLEVTYELIGGLGNFVQAGGSHSILERFVVGDDIAGAGRYALQGGVFSCGEMWFFESGMFEISGGIIESDFVWLGKMPFRATSASVMPSPGGILSITGSESTISFGRYAQGDGGQLHIGLSCLEHTIMGVADEARLGGKLLVELVDGFIPEYDDVITILWADGGVSSTFDSVLPGNGLISFDVVYSHNSVELTHFVIPEPATLSLLILGVLMVSRRRRAGS